MCQILPDEFVLSDDWATRHITVEDAFSHRSGYPRYDKAYGKEGEKQGDFIRLLRDLPMTAEPREAWQYQNIMFVALSHAFETVTKTPLDEYLRKYIWGPLGMKSTFLGKTPEENASKLQSLNADLATGYAWVPGDRSPLRSLTNTSEGGHFAAEPFMDMTSVTGAGAIITNTIDMIKYLSSLLTKSPLIPESGHAALREARSIVPKQFLLPISGQKPYSKGDTTYTLGWFHQVYTPPTGAAVEIFYHPGGLLGFGAEMDYIPDLDLGFAILGNSSPGANFAGKLIGHTIIHRVLGIPADVEGKFDLKKEFIAQEEAKIKSLSEARGKLFGKETGQVQQPPSLPLRDFCATYTHPAFGRVTVSLPTTRPDGPETETETEENLWIDPSPRTWPWTVKLVHVASDWFVAEVIRPFPSPSTRTTTTTTTTTTAATTTPSSHSTPSPRPTRDGSLESRTRAVFKVQPGHGVTSLGIELEPDLAQAEEQRQRRGRAEKVDGAMWDWDVAKGMIWFGRE